MKNNVIYSVHIPNTPTVTTEYGSLLTKQNVRAFDGLIRVVEDGDNYFGTGAAFRDYVLENPTWGSMKAAAGRMIATTGDQHHQFLEGAHLTGETELRKKDGRVIRIVRLMMGS